MFVFIFIFIFMHASRICNNQDITIRNGDKTNTYIILNKADYNSKKLKISSMTKQNFKNSAKIPQSTLKNILTKLSKPITQ